MSSIPKPSSHHPSLTLFPPLANNIVGNKSGMSSLLSVQGHANPPRPYCHPMLTTTTTTTELGRINIPPLVPHYTMSLERDSADVTVALPVAKNRVTNITE